MITLASGYAAKLSREIERFGLISLQTRNRVKTHRNGRPTFRGPMLRALAWPEGRLDADNDGDDR
jgi:hypothetical protein